MKTENIEWAINELTLTAERARDEGITPAEFLAALVAYTDRFEQSHVHIDDDD